MSLLHSGDAINSIGRALGKTIGTIFDNATSYYSGLAEDVSENGLNAFKNDKGKYDMKKIASVGIPAAYVTALGTRVLSGGGLYKNSDGETDIAGIPFI